MPAPRKVLHVIHSGAIGGGPRVVLELATRCPGRHTIASIEDGPLLADAGAAGLETIRLSHAGKYSMSLSLPALIRHMRTADIIHLHGQFAAFYGALAARVARTPMIYTAHFPSFLSDSGPITRIRNHVAELVPCRLAHMVVTCSETSRHEYLQRRLGRSPRIITIYNGVPEPEPEPSTAVETLRRELNLGSAPVIVALGRFTEQKGFDLLVDAFEQAIIDVPAARLVLVGDGPLRARLQQQSRFLGIDSAVRFTGFRRDTAAFYQLSAVVAVPSRYDIFPLVPLEAMRVGRPVVASDLPVFHEVLDDGETGLLVPRDPCRFAASLISLLMDPEDARIMGESARVEASKRFTVERMVDEYADLYEGLGDVTL
jgi:glycosyltransferase involved in cell wall biosynthesis